MRADGGLGRAAARLVREAGWPAPELFAELSWRGTPALTRRRTRISEERVFVLGDAAGYVEPFTGEGMAWALASGAAVAPLAARAVGEWRPELAPMGEPPPPRRDPSASPVPPRGGRAPSPGLHRPARALLAAPPRWPAPLLIISIISGL